jgi:2-methylcitrate dehydratase
VLADAKNRAEIERKFRSNVAKRWSPRQTDAILQALWSLEHTEDLSALLGQFKV